MTAAAELIRVELEREDVDIIDAVRAVAARARRNGATDERVLVDSLTAALCEHSYPEREARRHASTAVALSRIDVEEPNERETVRDNAEIDRELRAGENWPPRQPLPTPSVPSLSAELLPAALQPWLDDEAERLQVPLEMLAVPAMVGAASLLGRAVGMHPKRADSWLIVPNLWGLLVGRPGTMKTPALREGTRPIERLAAEAREAYLTTAARAEAEHEAIEMQIAALKTRTRKEDRDADAFTRELTSLLEQRERARRCERRYTTQDPTIEKLGELLNQNPRGLLLLRDELSGWIHTLSRAGREGERQFYLEGWNGLGSFTVDRIGRGTLHVPALTISVLGTIQPSKLRACLASGTEDGGDGLLQRFSLAVWPDVRADWRNVDRVPDARARERAFEAFAKLDTLTPDALHATAGHDKVPALRFAPDAQELFDAWRAELERRLRSTELAEYPAFEGHLAKYRKTMPALALLVHVFDVVSEESQPGPVTLRGAQRAAAWCDFLEEHARKLYVIEADATARATRALAAKIEAGEVSDVATVRDLYRPQWSGLATPELVDGAVARLAALNWLRTEERSTGGRPSVVIRLHPELPRRPDSGFAC
jgi:hypothetical protein